MMKQFVRHTRSMADALCRSLAGLDVDVRIAMTHYSPIEATLAGRAARDLPVPRQLPARRGDRHRRRPPRGPRPRPPRRPRRRDAVRGARCATSPSRSSADRSPSCACEPELLELLRGLSLRVLRSSAMGVFHRATITPTKHELIAAWAPTRPWGPPAGVPTNVIGSYRFDDPEGRVGMEIHLLDAGGMLLQVPLTYRDEPLTGAPTRSSRRWSTPCSEPGGCTTGCVIRGWS